MRNLYPAKALPAVEGDMEHSIRASIDNRAENRIGRTAVHQIGHPKYDFAAAGLELAAAGALGAVLPRISNFTATAMSGFGDKRDPLGSYETEDRKSVV